MNDLLADSLTMEALSGFTGASPRCVASTSREQLCEWSLGNRHPGWAPLAEAIDTGHRVALLCELPLDGADRLWDSCTAHPRRSSRDLWKVSLDRRHTRSEAQEVDQQREDARFAAQRELDGARNLVSLSRLVGVAPISCVAKSEAVHTCVWKTNNGTYGHGVLATAIGASYRKRVRMSCDLPADGGDRAPEACLVEIGI